MGSTVNIESDQIGRFRDLLKQPDSVHAPRVVVAATAALVGESTVRAVYSEQVSERDTRSTTWRVIVLIDSGAIGLIEVVADESDWDFDSYGDFRRADESRFSAELRPVEDIEALTLERASCRNAHGPASSWYVECTWAIQWRGAHEPSRFPIKNRPRTQDFEAADNLASQIRKAVSGS